MNKIKICNNCLYPSTHPLGITFNNEGICSGCVIHREKENLDWKFRLLKLKRIVKKYKSSIGNYDCIIPISSAQDSYFTVHVVKNILKLNPLLVCNNKYFNTEVGVKNLANLRIKFGCDTIFQNIDMRTVKKLTRFSLMEYGNIYWPIIAGHTSFPVKIAHKFKIPLIIWGAHQGLEQVGMYSHLHEVEMSRRYREDHDLFGKDELSLLNIDNDINEEDIVQFLYPDKKIINSIGIKGIYLGNFIRWDSIKQHNLMVKMFGYKSSAVNRTFDTYNYNDCYNYINLHDFLKLCKHGYSKVLDDACREIRFGRITREQGLYLVKNYEFNKIKYVNQFCEWIGVEVQSLNFVLNRFKNPTFWRQKDINNWSFNGISKILNKQIIKKQKVKLKNFKINYKEKNNNTYFYFGKGI